MHTPSASMAFKNGVRVLVVMVPLIAILTNKRLAPYVYNTTQLYWKTISCSIYTIVTILSLQFLTSIFLSSIDSCVTSYRPFGHDIDKRLYGEYKYDDQTKQIKAVWHYPHNRSDTLKAIVTKKHNELIFNGTIGASTIHMELLKRDPPRYP